ncbi:hypothetical protein ACHAXT_008483 [Thalassiosira profunda]
MRSHCALFACALALCLSRLSGLAVASSHAASSSCRTDDRDAASADALGRRGGGAIGVDDGVDHKTMDVIRRFLDSSPGNAQEYPFHIQGWRWHSMSLARDSRRLERLARRLSDTNDDDGYSALERAADYVVDFNMAGLFRIESKMFVKFLREHLCDVNSIGPYSKGAAAVEAAAFGKVVGKIDEHRVQSERIGKVLHEKAKAASDPSKSPHQRKQLLGEVAQSSRQLSDRLASMRQLQETLIVPAIARVVSSKVQTKFNNKVLLKLGILESRVHLVGMHDAVWESGIEVEKEMFQREIPYVARMMIERWRKSLYLPKAGALDYVPVE